MKRFFFFLAIVFCFASCEDFFSTTLKVDPPEHTPQIVLHTVLTNVDTLANAAIGRSVGLLENANTQDLYLQDATLALYQEDNKLFDYNVVDPSLNVAGGFNYTHSQGVPFVNSGQTYTIKANHPDFGAIEASQTMPQAVQITNTLIRENNGAIDTGERTDQAELTFTDPTGEENYYEVALFLTERFEEELFPFNLYTLTFDPNLKESFGDSFLFNDETFDGKEYKVLLDYERYWSDVQDIDVYAVFRTVTRDYYLYTLSAFKQEQSDDFGFFTEPVSIYSNIDNGLGIFGMRAEVVVKLTE